MEGMLLEKELGDFIESLQIGRADRYRNLSIFPSFSERKGESGYILLDEAVATGRFVVEEISEGGSVPELMARNLMPDLDRALLGPHDQHRCRYV
jgi:hypothetical protein